MTAAGAAAWVEIDLAALRGNVKALSRHLPSSCSITAVVKANAYGHGAVAVSRAALAAGARRLAVGTAEEGAELREAGISAPILIIGPSLPSQVETILAHGLTPTVADRALARALSERARAEVPVHVEVDTGMRRHGIAAAEAVSFCREVAGDRKLRFEGLYTHFAPRKKADVDGMREQLAVFAPILRDLEALGLRPEVHACNTLASLVLPEASFDSVRIGGGIYGLDPLAGSGPVRLLPVLSLKCRVAGLRDACRGDRVGYGGTFVCTRPTRLALLPVGYSDGISRAHWAGAEVLVRGRRVPIVGLISMNQTIADVTDVDGVSIGDEVVLIGEQGRLAIRAEERVVGTGSVYEITTQIARTMPRIARGGSGGPGRFARERISR
ncbi:MAG: hypothetical protein Fur0037_04360 [Planctomycetota bacterium]